MHRQLFAMAAALLGLACMTVACSAAPPADSPGTSDVPRVTVGAVTPEPPVASPAPSTAATTENPISPSPRGDPTSAPTPGETTSSAKPSDPPTPMAPGWQLVGQVASDHLVDGLLSFEAGYVAFSRMNFVGQSGIWHSLDGANWQPASLDARETCTDPDAEWPPAVEAGAGGGLTAVLVGSEAVLDRGYCRREARAWVTDDGLTWQRSEALGAPGESEANAVWAVPGGWEATVAQYSGDYDSVSTTVWSSPDGIHWEEASSVLWPPTHPIGTGPPAAATAGGSGLRLLSTYWTVAVGEDHSPQVYDPLLVTSPDGHEWSAVAGLDGVYESSQPFVTQILAPWNDSGWMLVAHDEFLSAARLLASSDLQSWSVDPLPRPIVQAALHTEHGLLVAGCRRPMERGCAQYLSLDGREWTELSPALDGAVMLADGPAGVFLMGVESGRVWALHVP